MTLALITAPTLAAVTLSEAKLHLRVDASDEDTLIAAMVAAATQRAQHETGRAMMSQVWEQRLDAFPDAEIDLGLPPVQSITSITYIDPAGATQTVAPINYTLDASTPGGWVVPALNYAWPETIAAANAVRVRFVTGAASQSDLPESLKAWILLQLGAMYKHREAFAAGVSVAELPGRFTDSLLDPHRYWRAA